MEKEQYDVCGCNLRQYIQKHIKKLIQIIIFWNCVELC